MQSGGWPVGFSGRRVAPTTSEAGKAALCKGYYSEEAELVEFVKNAVSQSRRRPSKFKTLECTIMDVADDSAKLPKKQERMRCICDFVACMTDKEAVDFYARLRSERHTTIFKPIG